MRRFIIEQKDTELTSHAGLALAGLALNRYSKLAGKVDRAIPLRHGVRHSDFLHTYTGLLCLGKNDFEAVNNVRTDDFFSESLGIAQVPSEATLRQRLDEQAEAFLPYVTAVSIDFLANAKATLTPVWTGHVPLDADVTPMDNSRTHKEGVSRTYKGHDGYAPMAVYLGREGYCLELEMREGKQHCQRETPEFLRWNLKHARRLTKAPLLLRLDSGNDAIENIQVILDHNENDETGADFVIKWNPRKEKVEDWLEYAQKHTECEEPREGKRVYLFDTRETRRYNGYEYTLRRVMRVIERTIDRHGQALLMPEISMAGWWTSLDHAPEEIIRLYADHGTSEQFHSEFKTDLDIERLPSGKMATNALVLACATLACNILRWIGQMSLLGPDSPVRHGSKRRRIKTVMQELMYLAARIKRTARRIKLDLGRCCPAGDVFQEFYRRMVHT